IKILAAVRRKARLAEYAMALFRSGRKVSDNEIYDDMFARLFRNRLHLANHNEIVVARRGTKDRKEALSKAIARAQASFAARWGQREFGRTVVRTAHPSESAGLQAVDYFLWALQRLYERREDRYFVPLRSHYRLIMDLDDTRRRAYGEWYSEANPLDLTQLMPVTG
ncbi:MAG TPA: DUF3800 domain-containing protein, partial [Thermoanaerobaculia bacterium]|nr:DUF3800 domain-containing protein [Thermoanaerobaculia bacterium]